MRYTPSKHKDQKHFTRTAGANGARRANLVTTYVRRGGKRR